MKTGNDVKFVVPMAPIKPAFRELDTVKLTSKVKGMRLKKGDVGTVMDTYIEKAQVTHQVTFEEKGSLLRFQSTSSSHGSPLSNSDDVSNGVEV